MIIKYNKFINESADNNIKFIVEEQRFKLLVNNELASYCIFGKIDANNRFLKFKEEVIELHQVNTIEKYKRKGYAEILLKKIFDYIKNTIHINYAILKVFKSNIPAINLYNKLGFELKDSSDDENPIFLMYKKL